MPLFKIPFLVTCQNHKMNKSFFKTVIQISLALQTHPLLLPSAKQITFPLKIFTFIKICPMPSLIQMTVAFLENCRLKKIQILCTVMQGLNQLLMVGGRA